MLFAEFMGSTLYSSNLCTQQVQQVSVLGIWQDQAAHAATLQVMPAQCNQFSNESRHHVHPLPYFPLTCLRLPSIHLLCCARGQHPCICRKTYSSTSGSCSAGASRHASGPRSSEMRSIQGMHMGLKQVIDCSPLELMFTVLG